MQSFVDRFRVTDSTRILDVGGTPYNWSLIDVLPQVTVVNLLSPIPDLPKNIRWVTGDGCSLPFSDQSFDIVFSNS